MRRLSLLIGLLAAASISAVTGALAETQALLYLDHSAVRPGDEVRAIVELRMPPHWHTYWRNPSEFGGVGLATRIEWTLPDGMTAGPISWPAPRKLPDPLGDTYIYEGVVRLIVPLKAASGIAAGNKTLRAKVSWQECEKECVLVKTNISVDLTVGDASTDSGHDSDFASALAALPKDLADPPATAAWAGPAEGDSRKLTISWKTDAADADFFAYESRTARLAARTERLGKADGFIRIQKSVDKPESGGWPTNVAGLLVTDPEQTSSSPAFAVALPISETEPASGGGDAAADSGLATVVPMLGLAFLGGLILNIMPCVLPVIALKILGFVRQAGSDPRRVRQLGLIYGAGVLASFLALGAVSLAVQAAGGVAGWSTAFQNPQFRVIMCVLLVLVALNLFGVFEVTLSVGAAADLTGHEGASGAFFNGVLAAVLATPCTAPFLATAVAFAFTQPPVVLLGIFAAVGLGLASPFVALCWQPAWLKVLPKPGAWMVRFKVAMGFPMLGAAVWVFWFTAKRMGDAGVLWFGLFLTVVAAAAWTWGEFAQRGGRARAGGLTAAALLATGYWGLLENQLDWRGANHEPKLEWQRWSPEAVEAARRAGHPAVVDFTADNCANCKFNKARAIDVTGTISKIRGYQAATFEADFTDADPVIAGALKQFGRRGVPLVLVYSKRPGLAPRQMPVVFNASDIQAALDWAAQ